MQIHHDDSNGNSGPIVIAFRGGAYHHAPKLNTAMPHRALLPLGLLVQRLTIIGTDAQMPRPLFIEGYAGRLSYPPDHEAELHISTSAARFAIEIHRIGATNVLVRQVRPEPIRND